MIIFDIILEASNKQIHELSRNHNLISAIINRLIANLPSSVSALTKILLADSIDDQIIVEFAPKVASFQDQNSRSFLAMRMLEILSKNPNTKKSILEDIINNVIDENQQRQIIDILIPHISSPAAINRNLAILRKDKGFLFDSLLSRIAEITEKLSSYKNLEPENIQFWSVLIFKSGVKHKEAQLLASNRALEYAFQLKSYPVSPLIVAAFPIVYASLSEEFQSPNFFTFFLWAGWDRKKTARRELISAFVNSAWPPIDLLNAAESASILEEVVRELIDDYRGRQSRLGDGKFVFNRLFQPGCSQGDILDKE